MWWGEQTPSQAGFDAGLSTLRLCETIECIKRLILGVHRPEAAVARNPEPVRAFRVQLGVGRRLGLRCERAGLACMALSNAQTVLRRCLIRLQQRQQLKP
jgi:hypothetical protein